MSQFRLVLLDYAKEQLDNPVAQQALSDLIFIKQKNFARTDPNYVVMDKHDMIGSHALIYETTNLFKPQLIFALRLTFEDRALNHKIKTPVQDLIPKLDERSQKAFHEFKSQHPVLVDCNSWFVDPNFSLKTSGLRLSDIGYTMVYLQVLRMGYDHLIGTTNEKYKASRWIEKVGTFTKGYNFIHPVVPDPHMFIMMEKFNHDYLKSVYLEYQPLFDELVEVSPTKVTYDTIAATIANNFTVASGVYNLERKKAG